MTEITTGNIRVFVLYPAGEGKSFDAEYWLSSHYDLLANGVWSDAISIEFNICAPDSPYVAVAHVVFADETSLNAAASNPGMVAVAADIAKYTNIEPIMFGSGVARGN